MARSKYGKYIIREPRGTVEENGKVKWRGVRVDHDQLGADCHLLYAAVTEPYVMVDKPHVHDFTHFLCFFGSNPLDYYDFDAEVEFYLGGERHIIDATSVVSVPAGLTHCPLIFKRIGKPIMVMEIMLTGHYVRKEPGK
ncbi:MAG: hypothetical protein ABID71_05365 [Chloroflexota bacterium]